MMPCPDSLYGRIIHIEKTDSTSDYLRRLCSDEEAPEFTTVQADYQTAGKGQRGNSWESGIAENLLFSTIIYPGFLEARNQFDLSRVVALAVKDVLDQFTGHISVKWPNDIYWKDRKICGILIENDLSGTAICRSIIGIGININQQVFQSKAPNPVSLTQVTGMNYELTPILETFLVKLQHYYGMLRSGKVNDIRAMYVNSLYRKEGWHMYADKNGEFSATMVEVKPSGVLVLMDKENRKREYAFKEVRYILPSDES